MPATKLNLQIDQGSTFTKTLDLLDGNNDPYVVTGHTGYAALKKTFTSNSYAVVCNTSLSNGYVTISLTAAQTADLLSGRYVYEIKTIAANVVTRWYEGLATVTDQVYDLFANS